MRNVDVDIPLGKITVITGVSGSGKTSLALDTLHAESQRRFVESLPIRDRVQAPRLDRPELKTVENLPASLAIGQHAHVGAEPVAESAGLLASLRTVFANNALTYCPNCSAPLIPVTVESLVDAFTAAADGTQVTLGFAQTIASADAWLQRSETWTKQGFVRVAVADRLARWEEFSLADSIYPLEVRVIVDRIRVGPKQDRGRIRESLQLALALGRGALEIRAEPGVVWRRESIQRHCFACDITAPAPAPKMLRLSNPEAACSTCKGVGLVKPKSKTKNTTAEASPCPACGGKRLAANSLAYRFLGHDFPGFLALSVDQAKHAVESAPSLVSRHAVQELLRRLNYLAGMGLGYLSLDRPMHSLSTGEARRVALTAAFGAGLSHALFLLDEPTAGLHPQDIDRLWSALTGLRDAGNTVVVVEHEAELIRRCDWALDMGPGAGPAGGRLVFAGPPTGMVDCQESVTGAQMSRKPIDRTPRESRGWLKLEGAKFRNLAELDVDIPLNTLCVVAGVSGAGKSTLVLDTLAPAVERFHADRAVAGERYRRLWNADRLDQVILVDALPPNKSSRSNPATFLKIFDGIRQQFAETAEARTRGLEAGDFSFNLDRGRCGKCQGEGQRTLSMSYLPDAQVTCDECLGLRYQQRILEVKLRGRSIAEVLDLTVREAFGFFRGDVSIQELLNQLIDVGLDYLRLGQPLATLSGGELQRLKLSRHLLTPRGRRCLFILDEPTIGLHPVDVGRLLGLFDDLLAVGHTIVVIDNDRDVLERSDYILELGPGAGPAGGRLIAQGPPAGIRELQTATGRLLR